MTQQIFEKILFPWLMLWFIGWAVQRRHFYGYKRIAEHSDIDSKPNALILYKNYLNAPWYWRLLLGYPPRFGLVSLRPAVFQFLISVTMIVQFLCMLVFKVSSNTLAPYDILWFIVLFIVWASVAEYWSRKREKKFKAQHQD